MKWIALLLACALILSACNNAQQPPQPETQEPQTDAAPAAQDNAADESAVQNPDKNEDASSDFLKLLGKQSALEWKIAYDVTSTYDKQTTTSKLAQYIKGEDVRMDISAQGYEVRTYVVDGTYTTCNKMSGDWSCQKFTPTEDDNKNFDIQEFQDDVKSDESDYAIVRDGTMTVAGTSTNCFKITSQGDEALVRYCISSDGAPLYIRTEGGGALSEMTATSYSKSVSSSDFKPPAEPTEGFGGAGGTSPAGGDACAYCNYLTGDDKDQCLASC